MERTEGLQFGTGKLWQPLVAKPRDQRRGTLLYTEKDEVGQSCFEQTFFGRKQEFRVVMVSHWPNCSIFLLAKLAAGEEKIFLPPAGVVKWATPYWECKVSLFSLGVQLTMGP